MYNLLISICSQIESPADVQLHLAALRGNAVQVKRVLDSGRVHVDCQDEVCVHQPQMKSTVQPYVGPIYYIYTQPQMLSNVPNILITLYWFTII